MLTKEQTIFAEDVLKLIEENRDTYRQVKRITSDYRLEKETTESYNGRQILELLQNADDAKTDTVVIELNREKRILTISNNGNPFTAEEGVASLMIAHTSSKKREFIGNKGLGFRSILNWVTEVKIITKTDTVVFSQKIANEEFNALPKESRSKLIEDNKEYLSKDEVPFAILAIPRLYVNEIPSTYETTIALKYLANKEEDIEGQIKLLASEILLFLNHIKTIIVKDSNGVLDKNFSKSSNEKGTIVTINEATWNIRDSGDVLNKTVKGKEQYYRYKIAWKDDLSDVNSKFFTYFPTQERAHLPFLIHATLELDPTRNHINNSKDNINLLSEIAKSIGYIAENSIKKETSDWSSFKFLSVDRENENEILTDFYQVIEDYRSTLEIFPCVDGSYCTYDDAVFYGAEFSNWVLQNNVESLFPNLIIPEVDVDVDFGNASEYTEEAWTDILGEITQQVNSISERAQLIKLLTQYSFDKIHTSKNKAPLLIDNSEGVIPEYRQAFMMNRKDIEKYFIPEAVEISFMSDSLFAELLKVFEEEIKEKRIENEHRSRPLKRLISNVVNIGSNDITDVIRHIVTTSENKIKNTEDGEEEKLKIVTEMVKSLFSIYQVNPDRRNNINLDVPLLNKDLEVSYAKDLFLGEGYDNGNKTTIVFKDIFDDSNYVLGNDYWKLEDNSIGYLDNFFLWLGVNRITKTKKTKVELHRNTEDSFTKFVFDQTNWPENNSHKVYEITEILDFEAIVKHPSFSIEVLVAWLISDSNLSRQLSFENEDSFKYSYHNKVTPLNQKPSYIYYQIVEKYLTDLNTKFIADLDFAKELGYNSIDFEHQVFKQLGIDENEIIIILNQLKVSRLFNDLKVEEVYSILQELPAISPEEKYVRKIYTLAFNFFKIKKDYDYINHIKDYKLLAKKRNKKKYVSAENVYYSDNSTLPSKIADDFWVFDFPKRLGESQISKFFGVKTFKEVDLEIYPDSITESNINTEFQKWFQKIKPYLLAYRLISIKNSIEKTEADELKRVDIKLVSSLQYNIEGGESKELLSGEFLPIPTNQGFYLCVEENTSLDLIKDTPKICEAFAEILCVLFKVNDHKDNYRVIFKDKRSLKDTIFTIEVNSLIENYNKALELLGISMDEIHFWTKIYVLKGKEFPKTIKDSDELSELVLRDLDFKFSKGYTGIDYGAFDNHLSIDFLKQITSKLSIPVSDLFDENFQGILEYHKKRFSIILLDFKEDFNTSLWTNLNNNRSEQKYLISYQENYERLIDSSTLESELLRNRFKLDIDYAKLLKQVVSESFGFEINLDSKACEIMIQSEYKPLLREKKVNEVDIEDSEHRSLLYFKGNKEEVLALLAASQDDDNSDLIDDINENKTGEIIYNSSKKVVPKESGGRSGRKGSWNHSDKDAKRNKMSGKKAEELVYNSLRKRDDVLKVEWVSSFSNTSDKSDEKHYDIRYKLEGSTNWKYLEVKAFNGTYFHLSKSEKREAVKQGKDYEIALVLGEQIHILKDYFAEDVDFENNNLFYATPSDYIISLKLKTE
ncbi:sacsin N-terminal ATP-binding-like domain-containing protein [Aquimarina algiphila]|uniref:sacsin N-terminal ATP-binding-like domain-containing protein n=1 Tax=Aquimarina algiphila TaxID=2047982 RepID=UPI0023301A1B|nr:DUF3883 domain-containing protein [Aquimarina algiphila]